MQLTRCRLFRAAHTVGLQRIKKPFSLSAAEFGFSCSTNVYIRVHACTHTHARPVYVHTRPGIAIEYDVRMHSLPIHQFLLPPTQRREIEFRFAAHTCI